MKKRNRFRGSALGILAAASLAMLAASPASGAHEAHFSALRMVHFAKPVAVPDFRLKDLKGNTVSFSQFKGKVVLLNFWTTW